MSGIILNLGENKEYKSFYKSVTGGEGNRCLYNTRLDNYSGCNSNCDYCYSRFLLNFRGLWNPENPSVADLKKVERKLDLVVKKREKEGITEPLVLRIGGLADNFQPIEQKKENTYQTIKMLNDRDIHYLLVTKYALVADDKYMNIYNKNLAHIQVSVTSTDDVLGKQYEQASLMSERIAAIEKLQREDFDISLRLSPVIEEFLDFDKLNEIKCDKILIEFLRTNSRIEKIFKNVDFSKYVLKEGNYKHLELEEKLKILNKITNFKEKSICEDVTEHYNYWKEHFNSHKVDCCNLRFR